MFLRRIKLKNFRCLHELEVDFLNDRGQVRKNTILLGENGTGKSNIMKAIAIITAGSDALPQILGDDIESFIMYGKEACYIEASLETKAGEKRQVSLEIRSGDKISDILGRSKESLADIDAALDHTDRNYFVVGYGASRRINKGEFIQLSNRRVNDRYASVRTLFDPNSVLNPLESWAVDLDYQKGEEGLNIVKEALNEFMKDVEFLRIDRSSKQLIFKTPDGEIPLNHLSDGYQNIAAWIGDLLYRVSSAYDDYKNPLSARGLLLIDEVDLHLHPKWQRILLDFLEDKLPQFQTISTTHSPLTAQQAKSDELLYLIRKEGVISIHNFGGSPRNMLVSQLLTSPAFGVNTDESFEVEELKRKHRELSAMKGRSAGQDKRLKEIEEQLEAVPDRSFQSELEKKQLDLLQKIDKFYTDDKS